MKDSYPDPDPAEESDSVRWHFDDHLESRLPIEPSPQFQGDYAFFDLDIPAELPWPEEVRRANCQPKNRFGHYILGDQIGCGPSGTVFRAWDTRWNQYAALKVLHKMEPGALERFTREAPRAAHLRHPGISTTYEAGAHLGQFYVAMSYIDGKPVDAERRSICLTLELMRDVCRAIEHAHDRGLVHGGIKPSNILVDRLDRAFVTDFGVPNHRLRSDPRDDVHDLGATLHELIRGAPASPELMSVVSRAMSPSRNRRYASAGELADDLDRLLLTRRYAGSYGLPLHLARKWGPVAVAGVVLAVIFAWVIPSFLGTATAAHVAPKDDPVSQAAVALLHLEELNDPASRVGEYRNQHLSDLPASLESRVLSIRASLAEGNTEQASRDLEKFDSKDYRAGFFRTLIELQAALAQPLPLPAPESPSPEWAGSPPDFRRFHDAFAEVLRAPVDTPEYRRDAEAARALDLLTEGNWLQASDKLTSLTRSQRLPVYVTARRTAAYMARRFDEVLDDPGTQFALALESANVAEELKRLRPLFAGCARREATLFCWSARRLVAQGSCPSTVVKEGLSLKLDEESQAVLRVADLRGNRSVAQPLFQICRDMLGDRPSTWMGRLASIEALLGIGRSLKLQGGNSRPVFGQALKEIDALPRETGWNAPRLLRAEALLGLCRYQEAKEEARRVSDTRGLLIAAAASLRMHDQVQDGVRCADRALGRVKDHPEALMLRAVGKIQCGSCKCALRDLDRVLDRAPNDVEARFYRAAAHFLSASADPASDVHLTNAIADLDRILTAVPDFGPADTLRSLARARLNRSADSIPHLRESLKRAAGDDTTELLTWLQTAWTND